MKKDAIKAVAFIFLMGNSLALSQIQTGTIVVISYTRDKIIIAADSRRLIALGKTLTDPRDDACKIAAFDNEIAFASAGVSGDRDWDVQKEARIIYEKQRSGAKSDHLLSDTCNQFADVIQSRIFSSYRSNPSVLTGYLQDRKGVSLSGHPIISSAVFAGIGEKGEPWLCYVEIPFVADSNDPIGKYIRQMLPPLNGLILNGALGRSEIADEFNNGDSPRAKALKSEWDQLMFCWKNQDELWEILLVDRTIKLLDGGNSPEVGGPIDAIKIERDGRGPQWIQLKPNCSPN